MQNLVIVSATSLSDRISGLVADFLAGRKPTTLRTYSQGLADFASFNGASNVTDGARRLLGLSHGEANHLVFNYRADMIERGLAANTINARLAAVRSLVKLGRTLGLVDWALDIANVKAQPYRDTTGPGYVGFRALLSELQGRTDPKAIRDLALIRLLFDRALRRCEVVSLDREHVDLERNRIAVLGKGASEREWLTIAEPTKAALAAWISVRGDHAGPLFTNFDRAKKGTGRISGEALRAMLRRLGERTGQRVRPHGLRHAAITTALDRSGGNVRAVQKFSRHATVQTVLKYDDNRADLGGEMSKLIAGG